MAYFYKDKRTTRKKNWRAVVNLFGQRYYAGYFLTKEEAKAYEARLKREMLEDAHTH